MPDITEPIPAGLGFEGAGAPASPVFSHGSNGRLWVDGFAAAVDLTEISLEYKLGLIETTPFGNTDTTFMPGKDSSSFGLGGFYTNNVSSPSSVFNSYLWDRKRDLLPITYLPRGGASIGEPAYFVNGRHSNHTVGTAIDNAAEFELDLTGSSVLCRGIVLKEDSTESTSGFSSSYDTGATRLGLKAMLNISATTGSLPTLDVTIQHSSDDSVWVNAMSFIQATEMGAEYKSDPTVVLNRYIRVSWTIAGSGASATFNVVTSQNGEFS